VAAPRIYLDANVFIAGFESLSSLAHPAQNLLRALISKSGSAVTSEITLAELLAPVQRPQAMSSTERRMIYLNLLQRDVIDLCPITRDILIKTADLRTIGNYKLADAIHVVTAIEAGCGYFVSNDDRIKKLPPGLPRIRADRAGVDELLLALS